MTAAVDAAGGAGGRFDDPRPGPGLTSKRAIPPERNFPLPVVIAHGLLAVTTIVLVLVTTLGGSLCPAVTGRRLAPDALERVAEGTF